MHQDGGPAKFSVISYNERELEGGELDAAYQLHALKKVLYPLGLIGHNGNDHYGNVACLLDFNADIEERTWLISGTKTGGIDPTEEDPLVQYTTVTGWNEHTFGARVEGPCLPSREMPTHIAINKMFHPYKHTIHFHHSHAWDVYGQEDFPSADGEWGSPELYAGIHTLNKRGGFDEGHHALRMNDHEEGFMSYGRTDEEALEAAIRIYFRAIKTDQPVIAVEQA